MMILLDINPLNKPVAISEIVILLIVAAIAGWLIGHWVAKGKTNGLRVRLSTLEGDLDDCRKSSRSRTVQPVLAGSQTVKRDNLKIIEGIGPKIEELLNKNGIYTFGQLADVDSARITEILQQAGSRFQIHDPATWPQQSQLAREGKWDELNELQDKLDGGRIE